MLVASQQQNGKKKKTTYSKPLEAMSNQIKTNLSRFVKFGRKRMKKIA